MSDFSQLSGLGFDLDDLWPFPKESQASQSSDDSSFTRMASDFVDFFPSQDWFVEGLGGDPWSTLDSQSSAQPPCPGLSSSTKSTTASPCSSPITPTEDIDLDEFFKNLGLPLDGAYSYINTPQVPLPSTYNITTSPPDFRDAAEGEYRELSLGHISDGCESSGRMIPLEAYTAAHAIIPPEVVVPHDFHAQAYAMHDADSIFDIHSSQEPPFPCDTFAISPDVQFALPEDELATISPLALSSSEASSTPPSPSPSTSSSATSSSSSSRKRKARRDSDGDSTSEPDSPSPNKKPKQVFVCHGGSQCGGDHDPKTFTRNYDLLRHIGTKPEPCPRCGVTLSRQDAFQRHVKNGKCKPKRK